MRYWTKNKNWLIPFGCMALGALASLCCRPQPGQVKSAVDAICVTAELWEPAPPEVLVLRGLCSRGASLPVLRKQLHVCLDGVKDSE